MYATMKGCYMHCGTVSTVSTHPVAAKQLSIARASQPAANYNLRPVLSRLKTSDAQHAHRPARPDRLATESPKYCFSFAIA